MHITKKQEGAEAKNQGDVFNWCRRLTGHAACSNWLHRLTVFAPLPGSVLWDLSPSLTHDAEPHNNAQTMMWYLIVGSNVHQVGLPESDRVDGSIRVCPTWPETVKHTYTLYLDVFPEIFEELCFLCVPCVFLTAEKRSRVAASPAFHDKLTGQRETANEEHNTRRLHWGRCAIFIKQYTSLHHRVAVEHTTLVPKIDIFSTDRQFF